jgi:hypothetical protein
LGDDLSGVTVCMHIPGFQATTASMVCELPLEAGPLRAWACLGSPCVGVFVPFIVPAVPEFLAETAQWERTSALRDRIDADHSTLAATRAVLDPLELELWQEADTLLDAPLDVWRRFGATCGVRVARAFTDLGV